MAGPESARLLLTVTEAEHDLAKGAEELVAIDTWCAATGFRELGEVRLRRGDLRGADKAFLRALELGSDGQPGLARLHLAEGDAEDALSGLRRAFASLQAARKCWCELDAPYEAAAVQVKLAEALDRNGDRRGARMQLTAALAAFERVGAQLDADRSRARLEMLGKPEPTVRGATVSRAWAFVEVVSAERLIEALGEEAWAEFEQWLIRALGRCCATHGGSPARPGLRGAFGAGFAGVEDAVGCAVEMQTSLREHRALHGFAPPLRAGVIAGDDEDALELARELASTGNAGDIVTTRAVASRGALGFEPLENRPEAVRLRWGDG